MPARYLLAALIGVTVLAGCGASQPGNSGAPDLTPKQQLTELHDQAGQLLDGGPKAFGQVAANLRNGYPLVVNQWASWCGPCRFEFPFFADMAKAYDGKVAFLGDVAQDSREDSQAFLDEHAVPYPHFYDVDASIARSFGGGRSWPTTVYFNRAGERVYVHQGAYADEQALEADIKKYTSG